MDKNKKRKISILLFFVIIWTFLFLYAIKRHKDLTSQKDDIIAFNNEIQSRIDLSYKLYKKQQNNISVAQNVYNYSDDGFFVKNKYKKLFGSIVNAEEKKNIINDINSNLQTEDGINISKSEILDYDSNLIKIEKKCGDFPCYTDKDFINIYKSFEDDINLTNEDSYIYGDNLVDSYIKKLAENLGYKKRGFAYEKDIIQFNGIKTRPEVRDAYIKMSNEMRKDGLKLYFVSGYRSSLKQRNIFKNKLGEIDNKDVLDKKLDKEILTVLEKISIPGYSKHHSGYALDFGCGNDYLVYSFSNTDCYDWLSKNNFENARHFGFIPSYPEGGEKQGPNPEPWEFVWVGTSNLK